MKPMDVYKKIVEKKTKISVIGMGYVGLPIAIAFDRKVDVIGYDINAQKIIKLNNNIDETDELEVDALKLSNVLFTNDPSHINEALFHIVAVPTPLKNDHTPDLAPLIKASEIIGKHLAKDSIIVFESTVYPGVTEEICVPIIEEFSGMKCGSDFKVGYSPERINPGDKVHRLETIVKVVSGMDEETLDTIGKVYELVVEAGIYKAKSIQVAEAAKVIENAQRDINIAFMNELALIFDRLGINTKDVLEAASTKWNFLNFYPGLVGGHCIGVDPYYLTYKARELGYESKIINSGRAINDDMGFFIAQKTIKIMLHNKLNMAKSKVGIFGFTFKEDCPDIRNTRVIDIYNELLSFGIEPLVYDPLASSDEVNTHYELKTVSKDHMTDLDVAIFAVSHKEFIDYDLEKVHALYSKESLKILIDVKSIYQSISFSDIIYWSL